DFGNDDPACRELCPPVFGAKGKFVDDVLRPEESEPEWTAVECRIWLDWRNFLSSFETLQREIVAELERRQGVKYDALPFDADAEVTAAKQKWTAEEDMNSTYVTVLAVVLLPEHGTAFQAAAKPPIMEKMDSITSLLMSVATVVKQWVRGIDSVEA
ncbi:hypothetical protein D0868_03024, partial [Hortaea werneckii]